MAWRKGVTAALSLVFLAGCSIFSGFAALSPAEKTHYEAVADQMTLSQKRHYLSLGTKEEREAYLAGLKVKDPHESAPVRSENLLPESAKATPASVQTSAPSNEVPPPSDEALIANEAPLAPKVSESEVARPVRPVPEFQYQKTGDPVTDVLTLLELYENGKITRDQFEQEKSVALNRPVETPAEAN